jgi:curved DNA-binding protein CbpA
MGPGRRQGEILVAMQVLSEEEVSVSLREHADAKLYEIFAWPGGEFSFELGARLRRGSGLARTSPANRILQGVSTRLPLERIDAWFEARADAALVRGQEPFYRFQEIDLDPEHRRWLEGLDGGRRLAEFHDAREELRRTIYGLFATGLIELREGGGAARPKQARARAPRPRPAPRAAPAPNPAADEAKRAELAAMAERFSGCGYFEILGVPETASDDQVRAAYERLAEQVHPDRVNAASEAVRQFAAETFAHVERAYETLRDPKRRQEYILDRKRQGREAAERELAQRALEAERHFQQGEAALRDRAYESALRSFGEALRLYPEDGEYHAHYGWALHMCHPDDAQMAEEAIEHVKRGIKLARDREKPYLLLGRLCKATGRVGAAEKMFTRAVQLQPNCVEALRELRLINMRRDRQKGFIGRLLRR